MQKQIIGLFLFTFLLAGCNGEVDQSDQDLMNQNVEAFLMLEDSIQVNTAIEDTVYLENLNEMIAQTEKNLNLIGMDLDTLSKMIDAAAYHKLALEGESINAGIFSKNKWKDSLQNREIQLLQLQLQQARLKDQENQFKQTNRVLFRLKRSVWANVAGFHVRAEYTVNKDTITMGLLLDANFNVVD